MKHTQNHQITFDSLKMPMPPIAALKLPKVHYSDIDKRSIQLEAKRQAMNNKGKGK